MEKEQKFLLVEAEVDYSGCWYEGDLPDASCSVREVSLLEAIKAISEESGLKEELVELLPHIIPPKEYRGGKKYSPCMPE